MKAVLEKKTTLRERPGEKIFRENFPAIPKVCLSFPMARLAFHLGWTEGNSRILERKLNAVYEEFNQLHQTKAKRLTTNKFFETAGSICGRAEGLYGEFTHSYRNGWYLGATAFFIEAAECNRKSEQVRQWTDIIEYGLWAGLRNQKSDRELRKKGNNLSKIKQCYLAAIKDFTAQMQLQHLREDRDLVKSGQEVSLIFEAAGSKATAQALEEEFDRGAASARQAFRKVFGKGHCLPKQNQIKNRRCADLTDFLVARRYKQAASKASSDFILYNGVSAAN